MTSAPTQTCDLCGLPAPPGSARLKSGNRELVFCCEGCLGIWRMLHGGETAAEPEKGKDEK